MRWAPPAGSVLANDAAGDGFYLHHHDLWTARGAGLQTAFHALGLAEQRTIRGEQRGAIFHLGGKPITSRIVKRACFADPPDGILRAATRRHVPGRIVQAFRYNTRDPYMASHFSFALRWFAGGRQTVRPSTELLSAWCLTQFGFVDPQLPWPAFAIELAEDLLFDPEGSPYTHLCVVNRVELGSYASEHRGMGIAAISRAGIQFFHFGAGTSDILEALNLRHTRRRREQARGRDETLIVRIVVGCIHALSAEVPQRRRVPQWTSEGPRALGQKPPHLALYVPVSDVRHPDLRAHVRALSRGEPGALSALRTLVRGHYRNQPCGPGARLRRRIWIAPHWRNHDADAMPLRTHTLG